MKSIGEIIKEARLGKKLSVSSLERITKIKTGFLLSLENEEWDKLPPFPTVLGFVKSVAKPLGLNESSTVAILKRDYPPKKEAINPKPDVTTKFTWGPKLTFIIGIVLVAGALLWYLITQYINFISPPKLKVDSPKDGERIEANFVAVTGETGADATLTVNNQPVIVDQNGHFSASIGITNETREIEIKAQGRSGKETVVRRKINQ